MDADPDEVRKGLAGVRGHLRRLRRSRAEDGRNVDCGVFENGVRRCDVAYIAAGAGVRHPRSGSDFAVLVDHLRGEVGLARRRERRPGRVEQRRRPVCERDAGASPARRREVAEGVAQIAHKRGVVDVVVARRQIGLAVRHAPRQALAVAVGVFDELHVGVAGQSEQHHFQ